MEDCRAPAVASAVLEKAILRDVPLQPAQGCGGGQSHSNASQITPFQTVQLTENGNESLSPCVQPLGGHIDSAAQRGTLFDIIAAVDMVEQQTQWKCSPVQAAAGVRRRTLDGTERPNPRPADEQRVRGPLEVQVPRRKRSQRSSSGGGSSLSLERQLFSSGGGGATDSCAQTTEHAHHCHSLGDAPMHRLSNGSHSLPPLPPKQLKRLCMPSPPSHQSSGMPAPAALASQPSHTSAASTRVKRAAAQRAGVRWRTAIASVTGEMSPGCLASSEQQQPVRRASSSTWATDSVYPQPSDTVFPQASPAPSFTPEQLAAWENGTARMSNAEALLISTATSALRSSVWQMQHSMRVHLTSMLMQANQSGATLHVPKILMKLCEEAPEQGSSGGNRVLPSPAAGPVTDPQDPARLRHSSSGSAARVAHHQPPPTANQPTARVPHDATMAAMAHAITRQPHRMSSSNTSLSLPGGAPQPPLHTNTLARDLAAGQPYSLPLPVMTTNVGASDAVSEVPRLSPSSTAPWFPDPQLGLPWHLVSATLAPTDTSLALSSAVSDLLRMAGAAAQQQNREQAAAAALPQASAATAPTFQQLQGGASNPSFQQLQPAAAPAPTFQQLQGGASNPSFQQLQPAAAPAPTFQQLQGGASNPSFQQLQPAAAPAPTFQQLQGGASNPSFQQLQPAAAPAPTFQQLQGGAPSPAFQQLQNQLQSGTPNPTFQQLQGTAPMPILHQLLQNSVSAPTFQQLQAVAPSPSMYPAQQQQLQQSYPPMMLAPSAAMANMNMWPTEQPAPLAPGMTNHNHSNNNTVWSPATTMQQQQHTNLPSPTAGTAVGQLSPAPNQHVYANQQMQMQQGAAMPTWQALTHTTMPSMMSSQCGMMGGGLRAGSNPGSFMTSPQPNPLPCDTLVMLTVSAGKQPHLNMMGGKTMANSPTRMAQMDHMGMAAQSHGCAGMLGGAPQQS